MNLFLISEKCKKIAYTKKQKTLEVLDKVNSNLTF
jgi:hypothetical protein